MGEALFLEVGRSVGGDVVVVVGSGSEAGSGLYVLVRVEGVGGCERDGA